MSARATLNDRGQLTADADLDDVLATGDEVELTAVWNTFHDRQLVHLSLDRLATDPDTPRRRGAERGLHAELAGTAEVTAVHALAASHRLVGLLTGRRWWVMHAAREAGASWADIGAALGMSRQSAHEWYQRNSERRERSRPDGDWLADVFGADVGDDAIAEQDWHVRARVRLRRDVRTGGSGGDRHGRAGQELTMLLRGRAGQPLDLDYWATDEPDLDALLAHTADVEVLQVLDETAPWPGRSLLPGTPTTREERS